MALPERDSRFNLVWDKDGHWLLGGKVAKERGLKARTHVNSWSRLSGTPLPAVAALRDGGFLFLGKVNEDKALVQSPSSPRPAPLRIGTPLDQ
jgi:hypothetical protein